MRVAIRDQKGKIRGWKDREGERAEVLPEHEAGEVKGAAPLEAESVAGISAVTAPAGIERELVVIGKCANPKMIKCWYMELAERRVCLVNVRRNVNFTKGMRFKMREPVREDEYRAPWLYMGRLPRLRGRW